MATAILSALDVKTGKVVWTMNVLEKFGGSNITWGISESPLVIGEKLLVNAGGPEASIVALNKKDGALIWKSQSDRAGYSSAMPVQIGNTTQVVFFTHKRAVGLDLKDGKLLWEYPRAANNVANAATPIVRGNRVFISSDYGNGARPGGNQGRRQSLGSLFHQRHAQPSQQLDSDWRPSVWILWRNLDCHAFRYG